VIRVSILLLCVNDELQLAPVRQRHDGQLKLPDDIYAITVIPDNTHSYYKDGGLLIVLVFVN
jgi:hypothetical protein